MKIVERALSAITPYGKNAKKHPEAQVQQIAASIREFGFNQPIVVDKEGVIIVGHGRFEAAKLLELEKVPVLEVDIDEARANAYRLADNKLNESEWDMSLVIEQLKELSLPMVDLTGFDRKLLLDNPEKNNSVPDVPETPRSVLGDLYEIGAHRVLCGDATKQEDVERLFGEGAKADMVLTDPPYNVGYTGKTKNALKIENDSQSAEAYQSLLIAAFSHADAHLKGGGVFYIWHADMERQNVVTAMTVMGWAPRQYLVWNKNAMVLGRQDYQWKHEPCIYGWKEGASHLWNADRSQVTVMNYDKPARSEKHPTMKPVELLAYQIGNNTKGEDIVYDPFLGSGSTLIAAQTTSRICYGMELDPRFADVIVQRYVDLTGDTNIKKNGEACVW